MASRVDKIYGDAYISVKTDEDDLLEALEEAKAVKEILDSNTDFVNFLNHPQITKEEKMEAAKNVFDGRVSDDMTGFLMIISGRHCQVVYDPNEDCFIITDLGSSYGTFLGNGKKLTANVAEKLSTGDTFYLCDNANRFVVSKE